jgi:hypothetical protein
MSHLFKNTTNAGNAHLAGQQNVLPRLGHRTVIGTDNQNRSVHLSRTGDHVLDIVCMARAVHVRIMASRRLILNVGRGDGDATLFFFWRLVNLIERNKIRHPLQTAQLVIAAVNVVFPWSM